MFLTAFIWSLDCVLTMLNCINIYLPLFCQINFALTILGKKKTFFSIFSSVSPVVIDRKFLREHGVVDGVVSKTSAHIFEDQKQHQLGGDHRPVHVALSSNRLVHFFMLLHTILLIFFTSFCGRVCY